MGPQTSYYTPQLLVEQVLDGPGIKARGVAFAGTNLFVQLGRGLDYAWSATSAGSDNIDTVVERLCNTDGSKPDGELDRLPGRQEVRRRWTSGRAQRDDHARTSPRRLPATTYEFQVLRTRNGIVQERTTVGGKPVAIVVQRSTYGHEVDSVLGFGELNDPTFVHEREDVPGGRERHRLHVQLVLRRQPRHRLLLLGPAPGALDEDRARPAALGRQEVRLEGLAVAGEARAGDQPGPRLPGQLEQQAGARLRGRRRHLELRLGLPLAGAREAPGRPDQGQQEDRHRGDGRRDVRRRHRRRAGGGDAAVAAEGDRQGQEDQAGHPRCSGPGCAPAPRGSTATATAPTSSRPRSRCSTPGGRTAGTRSPTT